MPPAAHLFVKRWVQKLLIIKRFPCFFLNSTTLGCNPLEDYSGLSIMKYRLPIPSEFPALSVTTHCIECKPLVYGVLSK